MEACHWPLNCGRIDPALKGTETHLISCLLAEIRSRNAIVGRSNPIRILDASCGNGDLISEVVEVLGDRRELAGRYEIFGSSGFQQIAEGAVFREKVLESLSERHTAIDWDGRILERAPGESWPFDDRFFDVCLSSQATEADGELGWYLEQQFRVLGDSGVGIHYTSAQGVSMFGTNEGRNQSESRSSLAHGNPIPAVRPFPTVWSWRRIQQVGERVGFKVRLSYNWALMRRILGGDQTAYSYPRGRFDGFARLFAAWFPITLALEKPRHG